MPPDPHDAAALVHYEALIAAHYPPHLAAMLAAARYQAQLERATPERGERPTASTPPHRKPGR